LEENLGAADIQLSANDLLEISNSLSQIEVHGHRYSAQGQQMVNR
jgi:hypothetical protein